jgi:hypothetical protein
VYLCTREKIILHISIIYPYLHNIGNGGGACRYDISQDSAGGDNGIYKG